MGFLDRLFKGKVFEDKRNPKMVCELSLCGEKYILSQFDMGYDHTTSSHDYFEAYAIFEEPVRAEVENWITMSGRKESGTVRFYRNDDVMDEGALFEVRFKDAHCVHYSRSQQDAVQITTIVMTIPAITMAGEEFQIKQ